MEPTLSALLLASPRLTAPIGLLRKMLPTLGAILGLVATFRSGSIDSTTAFEFKTRLETLQRELGRRIMEWTFNSFEPDERAAMPRELRFEGETYRRAKKSPRRYPIATLFGPIELVRFLYRPWSPGERSIFPLEINLGIEQGVATPALALRVGWLAAEMTQQQTLECLQRDHGVHWSVETLRKVTAAISASLNEQRHDVQVARLLDLLKQANESRGSRKIVLSVGRDGVFVPIRKRKQYQEAATATMAVFDRRGKRLGTVYLGRMPQPHQGTLSDQLTSLLVDALERWTGPMPRLCYVTDAGHHPTEYFRNVLSPMRHPVTNRPLHWEWIIDYYHVCSYVSKMAEAIFGEGEEAFAWARKMRRWLKNKPNGAYRVLHSAAALKARFGLHGTSKQFADAYRYIRERLGYLDYVDCRRRGLPIGSGITEAACKIVVTWRLKQSGMKWHIEGGQTILDLRVLRLSGVWKPARDAYLASKPVIELHPPTRYEKTAQCLKIAA